MLVLATTRCAVYPFAGAGAEMLKVRFAVAPAFTERVLGEKVSVMVTLTRELSGANWPLASLPVKVAVPNTNPVICGGLAGAV